MNKHWILCLIMTAFWFGYLIGRYQTENKYEEILKAFNIRKANQ